jgi:hypothetical protein
LQEIGYGGAYTACSGSSIMTGWHIAAGSWRNAVTPRKASAPFKSARFPIHRDLLGIDWNETPLA